MDPRKPVVGAVVPSAWMEAMCFVQEAVLGSYSKQYKILYQTIVNAIYGGTYALPKIECTCEEREKEVEVVVECLIEQ